MAFSIKDCFRNLSIWIYRLFVYQIWTKFTHLHERQHLYVRSKIFSGGNRLKKLNHLINLAIFSVMFWLSFIMKCFRLRRPKKLENILKHFLGNYQKNSTNAAFLYSICALLCLFQLSNLPLHLPHHFSYLQFINFKVRYVTYDDNLL